jgi:beta-N-acetylhexosaminidase
VALLAVAGVALVVGLAVGGGAGEQEPVTRGGDARPTALRKRAVERLSLRQRVGQVLISSFDETRMPDYIRRRLGARESAGVVLFGRNGGEAAHWRDLVASLQRAAGGRVLVMVDQEGGDIRTVGFAGPFEGQPEQGGARAVRDEALEAGHALRLVGVNVTLAPVVDVGASGSVMASRAFAGDASAVAEATRASVRGWRAARVAATAKHFPGLAGAAVNTDDAAVTVDAARTVLDGRDLVPFRAAIKEDVPLVMVSHALYPALDPERIASQSPRIVNGLLRSKLGYQGVVVTDSLEAQAVLDRSDVGVAAERSIQAGADLVLMTGSASWNDVFPRLLERARESVAFRRRIDESAARVLGLKRRLGLRD